MCSCCFLKVRFCPRQPRSCLGYSLRKNRQLLGLALSLQTGLFYVRSKFGGCAILLTAKRAGRHLKFIDQATSFRKQGGQTFMNRCPSGRNSKSAFRVGVLASQGNQLRLYPPPSLLQFEFVIPLLC